MISTLCLQSGAPPAEIDSGRYLPNIFPTALLRVLIFPTIDRHTVVNTGVNTNNDVSRRRPAAEAAQEV